MDPNYISTRDLQTALCRASREALELSQAALEVLDSPPWPADLTPDLDVDLIGFSGCLLRMLEMVESDCRLGRAYIIWSDDDSRPWPAVEFAGQALEVELLDHVSNIIAIATELLGREDATTDDGDLQGLLWIAHYMRGAIDGNLRVDDDEIEEIRQRRLGVIFPIPATGTAAVPEPVPEPIRFREWL